MLMYSRSYKYINIFYCFTFELHVYFTCTKYSVYHQTYIIHRIRIFLLFLQKAYLPEIYRMISEIIALFLMEYYPEWENVCMYVCMCVCVCERERATIIDKSSRPSCLSILLNLFYIKLNVWLLLYSLYKSSNSFINSKITRPLSFYRNIIYVNPCIVKLLLDRFTYFQYFSWINRCPFTQRLL